MNVSPVARAEAFHDAGAGFGTSPRAASISAFHAAT